MQSKKTKTPAKGAKTPVKGKQKPAQLTRRGTVKPLKKPIVKLGESISGKKGEYTIVKSSNGGYAVLFNPYTEWNGKKIVSYRNVSKTEVGSLAECRKYIGMATGTAKEQAALKKNPKWNARKNEPHQGYKNYDTFSLAMQIKNNSETYKFLSQKKNRSALMKMSRDDLAKTLKAHGADLRGIIVQNVNTQEIKKLLNEKGAYPD